MNRKKKIIYITGIFAVLVAIIGFTFAYIGTRILGNSNSKEMSFTAKKVSVTYKEISNTSSGETISPGYQYLKIFTATNTGNVEVIYHIYLDEVENDFIRVQDITYTLYRKSGNNTITSSNLSSAEVIASGTFPIVNQYIKTDEVLTKPNDVYTYALKINYNTSTESQDSDSGHVFGFKVQLHTNKDETYGENTLAYNVIKNAIGVTDTEEQSGTAKYRPTPTTNVASEVSASKEADLSQTMDDYGKTFYFRGNVKNNYVSFAGKTWRIIRVSGDGSVKLLLDTPLGTTANYGYNSDKYMDFLGFENGLADSLRNFQTTNISSYLNKLKNEEWCYDDNFIKYDSSGNRSYGAYDRLVTQSKSSLNLKCPIENKITKYRDGTSMYVGAITAEEVAYAGGRSSVSTTTTNQYYYLFINNKWQWTLSPSFWEKSMNVSSILAASRIFVISNKGALYHKGSAYSSYYVRPVVVLLPGTVISSGIGTSTSPYVIE